MKVIYQENSLVQADFSKITRSGVTVFNWFADQMRSRPYIKESIKNIEIATGLSESTVHRWISVLKKENILKVEQKYGQYSQNTFTINREVYRLARYLKYQFASLWRYLLFVYLAPRKKTDTPLIEEDVFINSCLSNTITRESKKTPVFNTRGLKNQKREEMESVMEVSPPKISPTLKEITDKLNLNKLGQLKLLVFHEQVLSDAWNDYKKLGKINHPFDYLVVNCIQKSENRGIPVYWDLFYTSCQRYGLTDNKHYVSSKPKIIPVMQEERVVIRPHADKSQPHPMFAEFFEIAQQNSSE